jgi:signal transduction histidine kinase/ligand-binding sensor domain-containing protein
MRLVVPALAVAIVLAGSGRSYALDPTQAASRYGRAYWSVDKGLVFGSVHALAQDRDGYLWLGTDEGLVRFDGTAFLPWPIGEARTQRPIQVLLTAREGSLWVGGYGIRRIKDGKVVAYGWRDGFRLAHVAAIAEDADGAVWAGGSEGAFVFRDGHWTGVALETGLPQAAVSRLYTDPRGDLWLSTPLGTFRRPRGRVRFTRVTDYSVSAINVDAAGELWTADVKHGVRHVASVSAVLHQFAGEAGMTLLRDRDGNLWIGTVGLGIWRVTNGGRHSHVDRVLLDSSRSGTGVVHMLEDRDGNIWIAAGASLVRLSNSDVTMISRTDGLPDTGVSAIAVTHDKVWVATSQGLYSILLMPSGQLTVRKEMPEAVTALHVDASDRLWLATVHRHAGKYEIGTFERGGFSPVPLPHSAVLATVVAMTTDGEGALWMCDQLQGLLRWHAQHLERYETLGDLGRVTCTSAGFDSFLRPWFGFSTGGVASYQNGQFRTYHDANGAASAGLGERATVDVGRGSVWLTTRTSMAELVNDRFRPLLSGPDLPAFVTAGLAEDRDGNIWSGVSAGILRVAKAATGTPVDFRLFTEADGLVGTVGSHAGWPAATQSRDGRLWFASSRGVAMVDPARLRDRTAPPFARIDAVTVDDRTLAPKASIDIPPGTTKLEIHYGALNLSAPESMRFRYRLDGVDADWVEAGARRDATYVNLAPHAYTFHLAVSHRGERWTGAESQLALRVRPRFQQTGWFYGVVCCIGALILGYAWWLRLRIVKARFSSVLAERARVAREIHDTLLQSLGSVAIDLETLTHDVPRSQPAVIATLRGIRRRVTELVRETRESIEQLRSTKYGDYNLVTSLTELTKSESERTGVTCSLTIAGSYQSCGRLVEEQLLRITQEAVANALRHGRAHDVEVEIEYHADSVFLCVTDDGCGFDPERSPDTRTSHWGIASMRERAAMIGASFHIESTLGEGTQVQVVAPLETVIHTS